jgi:hypothetical protein
MGDFFDGFVWTKRLASQTSRTAIKIDPWFFREIFSENRLHRTIFFDRARLAVLTFIRLYQRPFHSY